MDEIFESLIGSRLLDTFYGRSLNDFEMHEYNYLNKRFDKELTIVNDILLNNSKIKGLDNSIKVSIGIELLFLIIERNEVAHDKMDEDLLIESSIINLKIRELTVK